MSGEMKWVLGRMKRGGVEVGDLQTFSSKNLFRHLLFHVFL